jgi:hypothetical protein
MLFAADAWVLLTAELRVPVPHFAENVPVGSEKCWNEWRENRICMVNKMSTDSKIVRNLTYTVCSDWFKILANHRFTVSTDKRWFVPSWSVADDRDESVVWKISCAKWETVCVLARVITLNLNAWAKSNDKIACGEILRDTVGCCRRALLEITSWKRDGNLSSWNLNADDAPLEIQRSFFETLRGLSEMLFELTCLGRANTPSEICAHDYNCLLLTVLNRAEALRMDDEIVPFSLKLFVKQSCTIVIMAVGATLCKNAHALRVLHPPETVRWKFVQMQYAAAKVAFEESRCFDEHRVLTSNVSLDTLTDVLQCTSRVAKGTAAGNALVPATMPCSIEYNFPF